MSANKKKEDYMIYTVPKLISLDSLNLTYKEAFGVDCSNGSGNLATCSNGTGPGLCGTGSGF